MAVAKRLVGYLLLVAFSSKCLGLILDDNLNQSLSAPLDRVLDDKTAGEVIEFADSIFECGVYYQYTAGGLKNNPNVPRETVQFVSGNSQSLLKTADQLYTATGISTQVRYDQLMHRARTMLQNREYRAGVSDPIFEFGEKCRLVLRAYPVRLGEISELLERH